MYLRLQGGAENLGDSHSGQHLETSSDSPSRSESDVMKDYDTILSTPGSGGVTESGTQPPFSPGCISIQSMPEPRIRR